MFCSKCGSFNAEGSMFCKKCGVPFRGGENKSETTASLPVVEAETEEEEEEEVELPEEKLEKGKAALVMKKGPDAGTRFILDSDVTSAGRHPESDIFLDDITVSRMHAEIKRNEGSFEIVDVGSLNGTYVNRERIDRADLKNGDEIQVGKFKLLFFTAT